VTTLGTYYFLFTVRLLMIFRR